MIAIRCGVSLADISALFRSILRKIAALGSYLTRSRPRRWIIIGLVVFGEFLYEFTEHTLIGENAFQQADFRRDVVFYGIFAFLSARYILDRLETLSDAYSQSKMNYYNLDGFLDQLSQAEDFHKVAAIFLQSVSSSFQISASQLLIYNSNELDSYYTTDFSPNQAKLPKPTPQRGDVNCSLNQLSLSEKSPLLESCTCLQNLPDQPWPHHFCFPIKSGDDHLVGILYLHHTEPLTFNSEQTSFLKRMATEVDITLERIQMRETLDQNQSSQNDVQHMIARDVHATLGHNLAFMRMKLAQLAIINNKGDPALHGELSQLNETANETYQQMRDLLVVLTPESTSNLRSKMISYAQRIADRANFNLDIQMMGEIKQLPPNVLQHIILIVREALGNIEKHAQAKNVDLKLAWEDDGLVIEITDDGRGFEPREVARTNHYGMRFLRERTEEVNGDLIINSAIDSGTTITLWVPYQFD